MAKTTPFKYVRIDEATWQDLEIIAKQQDRSVTWLINQLLAQAVNATKIGLDRDEL